MCLFVPRWETGKDNRESFLDYIAIVNIDKLEWCRDWIEFYLSILIKKYTNL